MDPNATLRIINDARATSDSECREAILNLEAWIVRGGFAPDWDAYPRGARRFRHSTSARYIGKGR